MDRTLERSTMRKVYIRLLPFAVLSYILAYIDRINVSFAGLTMRTDIGMSTGTFRFAVGMFYKLFIFEVPSNVILEKIGAEYGSRIMITGDPRGLHRRSDGLTSFGIVRPLGVARPVSFRHHLCHLWFPGYHHARIVSGFLVGLPVRRNRRADIDGTLGLDGLFGLRVGRSCIAEGPDRYHECSPSSC